MIDPRTLGLLGLILALVIMAAFVAYIVTDRGDE